MFAVTVSQNPYLSPGSNEVHAVITVEAKPDPIASVPKPTPDKPSTLVFGILLDCSGSMGEDDDLRMEQARRAVLDVVRLLQPHNYFFIVAGRNNAQTIVQVCAATPENKERAERLVSLLKAGDGTCMSAWLVEAKFQFDYYRLKFRDASQPICQLLLLTDGKNDEHDHLNEAVRECLGNFQVHARGVGTDWQVAELRQMATQLLGTVEIIPEAQLMTDSFREILTSAQSQVLSQVRIRLWVPQGSSIVFLKQVSPDIMNLAALSQQIPDKPNTIDFETGSWAESETRDYHLLVRVRSGEIGQKMLAARVTLLGNRGQFEKLGEAQIIASWTQEAFQTGLIDPTVAYYTGQGQLAMAIQEGLAARSRGDDAEATRKLGLAYKLAEGTEGTTRLLRKVVEVVDEDKGTVRLRRVIDEADAMALDTRSTRTRRIHSQVQTNPSESTGATP